MPKTANLEISHHIGNVGIYSDLSHLPEDEQVKRSITRARNQASAERRRNGEVKTRGKRSSTVSKAPAKSVSLLTKLGLADSEAAKGLHAAHLERVRLHDGKLREFTQKHDAEREEMEKAHEAKLGSVDGLIRMLDMARQLPDNTRIVADLEKRLASF